MSLARRPGARSSATWANLLAVAAGFLLLAVSSRGLHLQQPGQQTSVGLSEHHVVVMAQGGAFQGRALRGEESPSIPFSTLECNAAEWKTKVCFVRNLYIAGEAAVFVAQDPGVPLPDLRLNEYADREGNPRFALHQILRVMSQQEAASLFTSTDATLTREPAGEKNAGGASHGGSSSSRRRRLWQAEAGQQTKVKAETKQQQGQQQQGQQQQGPGWRFPVLDSMVVAQTVMLTNWWHAMDDISQVAFRFCKYLGRCHFQDLRASSSGVAYFPVPGLNEMPPAAREALGCFGDVFRVVPNATQAHMLTDNRDRVVPVLVRRAVVGVGDEILHPYEAERCGVKRANDTMRLMNIEFMRQCAGLPLESPPRQVPTLRIVNREYGAGRTIMGAAEILDVLQKKRGGLKLNPVLSYVSGLSFGQQARMFDETDILVEIHGAATANWIFLPRKAVVIDPAPWDAYMGHEKSILEGLPKPAFNISFMPVLCEECVEPMVGKLKASSKFNGLSEADQLYLLLNNTIKDNKAVAIANAAFGSWHTFNYFLNVRPKVDVMVAKILEAADIWYAKHQGK